MTKTRFKHKILHGRPIQSEERKKKVKKNHWQIILIKFSDKFNYEFQDENIFKY